MTEELVLIFTIRPVQAFISQARKFIDLFNGSLMLSDITKDAMSYASELTGSKDFVYPKFDLQTKDSFPNVFILQFPGGENWESIGESIRKHITENLVAKLHKLVSKYKEIGEKTAKRMEGQLIHTFQFDWVVIPVDEDQSLTSKRLKKLLAAVKRSSFPDNAVSESGKKCSLCGERNALIGFSRNGKFRKKNKGQVIIKRFNPRDGADGEGLCGVCFLKRNWKPGGVKSVAEIANSDVFKIIEPLEEYKQIREVFKDLEDLIMFLTENREERTYNLDYDEEEIEQLEPIRKQLLSRMRKDPEILEKNNDQKVSFRSYYALLLMDGDGMGKIVSGQYMNPDERKVLFEKQREVSEELTRYTAEVRRIIDGGDHEHKLIYAGGDDVFVLFNMEEAIKLTRELRDKYPAQLGGKENPTASAGLVVAHFKSNLAHVLNKLREMEKRAKSVDGKDAISVMIMARSGSTVSGTFKWRYGGVDSMEVFQRVQRLLRSRELSSTFIRQLIEEFEFVKENDERVNKMIGYELKRLIERSKPKKGSGQEESIEKVVEMCEKVLEGGGYQKLIELLKLADSWNRRT